MSLFTGSGVAICTPFNDDGINFDAYQRLLDFQLSQNTDAIIVCGTTGEPSTMTVQEKISLIDFTVKNVNNRVPVIAGTGGNNTSEVIKISEKAQELGVDGLLIVTPYYNKTTQKGLIQHYTAINKAVDIPIIIYNVPGRTGLNISPETVAQLAHLENISGIKEASGNIAQIMEVSRQCQGKLDIYSGNDDHVLPILSVGGKGVISVAANIIPKDMHDLVETFMKGDIASSRKIQFRINPLVKALFSEVNPIPVKTALNLLGFDFGNPRLPLTTMDGKNLNALKDEMVSYGLKL